MEIKRDFIFDPSLVLYLPLYKLDSASFMSKDAYGHLCSVTGALWSPKGRKFDGIDDVIVCGGATDIQPALITAEAWFYAATTMADYEVIFGNTAGNLQTGWAIDWWFNKIRFYIQHYSTNQAYSDLTPDNRWHHIIGTYNGATIKIFHDMVQGTDDTYGTGMDYTGATGVMLGSPVSGGNPYRFSSIVGEARLYSRVFAFPEIQHNYEATKWRYK